MAGKAMDAAQAVLAKRMTQSDAARHFGVSRQAVHRALERLAKRRGKEQADAIGNAGAESQDDGAC